MYDGQGPLAIMLLLAIAANFGLVRIINTQGEIIESRGRIIESFEATITTQQGLIEIQAQMNEIDRRSRELAEISGFRELLEALDTQSAASSPSP